MYVGKALGHIPIYLPGKKKNHPFYKILRFERPTNVQNAYHSTEDLKNSTFSSYLKAPNSKLYLSQEDLSLFYSCFLPTKWHRAHSELQSNLHHFNKAFPYTAHLNDYLLCGCQTYSS